ncbi:MAG TPA: Spy/CpxP family protein refolding chaperone [Microvirga sp.]|nr:Spy/CpxP family protein refolding chaperone [Microvirga sp.]
MNILKILAGASLLALVGAAASAQTAAPPPGASAPPSQTAPGPDQSPRAGGLSRADLDALTDARIAGILAGLKLTPEQQPLWTPVEQALRARAAERAERVAERRRLMQERREQRGRREPELDITQRFEQQAEDAARRARQAADRAEALRALATAIKPFYASLNDNQKRLLPVLMREGRGFGPRMRGHHERRHGMGRDRMMERHGTGRGMMEGAPQRYH